MLPLLLSLLLQGQRLSPLVLIGLVLFFLIGVTLLIYFFRRFRESDKEAEDDWSVSRRSLFAAGGTEQAAAPALEEEAHPLGEGAGATEPSLEPEIAVVSEQTALVADSTRHESAVGKSAPEAGIEPAQTQALLSSAGPNEEATGTTPFDEVWADLEQAAREPGLPPGSGPGEDHSVEDSIELPEPLPIARVEERSPREPFEPPRIEVVRRREPFEPPSIEVIEPHHETPPARSVPFVGPTSLLGSERVTDVPPQPALTSAAAAPPEGSRMHAAPMGSVLGLPAGASDKPLILGTPARHTDETGISGLSDYGKEVGPEAGRGGTIALVVAIVLVGGFVVAYLQVPEVKSRVNAWVTRVRGGEQSQPALPQAQIFPSRGEADKNIVKASGWVANISNDPLSELSIEVVLQGLSSADTVTVKVEPAEIQPQSQGRYQFEYDGKEYPAGYRITKLITAGKEIPFARPPQGTASR